MYTLAVVIFHTTIMRNKKLLLFAVIWALFDLLDTCGDEAKIKYIKWFIDRDTNYYHEMSELPRYAVYYQATFTYEN